jgi:hypothetical protein
MCTPRKTDYLNNNKPNREGFGSSFELLVLRVIRKPVRHGDKLL